MIRLLITLILLICGVIPLAQGADPASTSAVVDNRREGVNNPITSIDIAGLTDRRVVNGSFGLLLDHDGLAFSQIRTRAESSWRTFAVPTVNFGQSTAAFWFRFTLRGADRLGELTYLRLNYPHLDQFDFYVLRDGTLLQHIQTGDTTLFNTRPIRHRNFLFPIDPTWGDHVEIYLRTQSCGPIKVPLDIITRRALDQDDQIQFAWYGAYFAVTLAMLLYNAFILLLVRDITYFYYILYVASAMALQFTLQGFGFEYLWPWSVTLNNTMVVLLTGVMPVCALVFGGRFVNLRENGTKAEQYTLIALLIGFAVALISVFTMSYHVTLTLETALSTLSLLASCFIGVKYWVKGLKAARIFTIAWLVYLLFIGYYLLDVAGLQQPNVISLHAMEIGSLIELLLLSLSFADRINHEKELRLAAQKHALDTQFQLHRDLDELVRARTAQLEDANTRLLEISTTDGLTGLHNRRYFNEIYDREYRRAFREQRPIAVLMIDIDHFKAINDAYGHQTGDACLAQVANVIHSSVRRPPDLPARYGGEEFIALLPATHLSGACHVAEAMRAAIAALDIVHHGTHLRAPVSIGVASEIPESAEHGEALIKQADERLYYAKSSGRNQIQSGVDAANAAAGSARATVTLSTPRAGTPGNADDDNMSDYAVLV